MPSQITVLIPLPTFYNPNAAGTRQMIEEDKFVMSVFEVDMLDTDENHRWLRAYAKDVLLKRFRQDAIYLRFIGPVESLEVTEETVVE